MEISLAAETVFKIGNFPITNSVLTTWVVMAVLLLLAMLSRRVRLVPRQLQNITEILVLWLYDLTLSIVNNDKIARRIFPLMAVFFIFILVSSLAGLLPGAGSIGIFHLVDGKETLVPLFRAPTSDLNTTFALAVISATVYTFLGISTIGFVEYAKKFVRLSSPIDFFVGILEFISEFSKIISFGFRLFGNIFAGEVLISVVTFLVPYILPAPLYGFEIFVAFIQAFVFTVLSIVFTALAIQKHEADHAEPEPKPQSEPAAAPTLINQTNN